MEERVAWPGTKVDSLNRGYSIGYYLSLIMYRCYSA